MELKKVTDAAFKKYGRVIREIDFTGLVEALNTKTPTVNTPTLSLSGGQNYLLNALEYHRSSEINVAGTDAVLLVGSQQDITDEFTYDTSRVEAFLLPKGTAVEVYATTLHYAPCSVGDNKFQVAIVLPKDTNLPLEKGHEGWEDKLLAAKNKWLIGHPEGGLPEGSHIGLVGENISVK